VSGRDVPKQPPKYRFWPERKQGPVDDAYVQSRWVRPYRPGAIRVAASLLVPFSRNSELPSVSGPED